MNFHLKSLFALIFVFVTICHVALAGKFVKNILKIIKILNWFFEGDCDYEGHKFNKDETYTPAGKCIKVTCTGKGTIGVLG